MTTAIIENAPFSRSIIASKTGNREKGAVLGRAFDDDSITRQRSRSLPVTMDSTATLTWNANDRVDLTLIKSLSYKL